MELSRTGLYVIGIPPRGPFAISTRRSFSYDSRLHTSSLPAQNIRTTYRNLLPKVEVEQQNETSMHHPPNSFRMVRRPNL